MASRMMAVALRHQPAASSSMMIVRAAHGGVNAHLAEKMEKLGNRDVVGFGWNGEPTYYDRPDFPMPAIRFKENTPDVLVIFMSHLFLLSKFLTLVNFLGSSSKGKGRLEKTLRSRKEGTLPCIILSNIR